MLRGGRWPALLLLLFSLPLLATELADFAASDALLPDHPREAYEAAERAIWTLRAQDPERVRWYAIASEAAFALSLPDIAMRYAGDGLGSLDIEPELQNRLTLANALSLSGRPTDALERLQPLLARPDLPQRVEVLMAHALALTRLNDFRTAVTDLLTAYELAPPAGTRLVRAHIAVRLGATYRQMHDEARASRYLREACQYFGQDQRQLMQAHCELELAQTQLQAAKLEEASHVFASAREHSLQSRDEQGRAYAELGLAQIALEQGRDTQAKSALESAYKVLMRVNDMTPLVAIERGLGRLAMRRGAQDEALQHLLQAEKFARMVNDASLLISVLGELGEMQASRGEFHLAFELGKESARLREKQADAEKDRTLAELRVRFDSEQQEQKNALLEKQAALNQAQLSEQRQRNRVVILAAVALIAVIGLLLFIAWRARQVRQQLLRLALTDELTHMPNRRAIMDVLQQEFERARRYKTALSIAMMDLDHFKAINDRYGHDAGDEVLQAFGDMLQRSLRKTDAYGRFGGEEFVVVLTHTSREDALLVVERLRQATQALLCPKLQGERRPSVSVGVAVFSGADADAEILLKRADMAVYQAKHDGRNCVRVAD